MGKLRHREVKQLAPDTQLRLRGSHPLSYMTPPHALPPHAFHWGQEASSCHWVRNPPVTAPGVLNSLAA